MRVNRRGPRGFPPDAIPAAVIPRIQGEGNPVEIFKTGGCRSYPAGGPQSVHFQVLVPQLAGDRQSPFGVRGRLRMEARVNRCVTGPGTAQRFISGGQSGQVEMAARHQRQSFGAPVTELESQLMGPFESVAGLLDGWAVIQATT